jgi:uncharacterized protein YkwD
MKEEGQMDWTRRKDQTKGTGHWHKNLLWLAVVLAGLVLCLPPVVTAQTVIGEPESFTRPESGALDEEIAAESGGKGPSLTVAQRQQVLKLVNRARAVGRNCGDRFFGPTHRLIWDGRLARAAQRHSRDMATHNFFDHTGSDGTDAGDRIEDTGYNWQTWGENISAGRTSIRAVVNEWLASPGHCANIMNPDFEEMGLGKARNAASDHGIYWTQVFGTTF